MRFQEWTTPGQSDLFEIPDDCCQIIVTGCGAGAGGAGSTGTTGAAGGAASPCVVRLPLTVQPGGVLAIYIGAPSIGGIGGNSSSLSSSGFNRHTGIIGRALIDQLCASVYPGLPFFIIGWGGESSLGTPCVPDYGYGSFTVAATLLTNGTAPKWVGSSISNLWPWVNIGQGSSDGGAQAPPGDPRTYGVAGVNTLNGRGYGTALASNATYSSGAAGGGCAFGKGGESGQYTGGAPNDGGDATGYGSGGGGGSGTSGTSTSGGDGTGGYLRIDY